MKVRYEPISRPSMRPPANRHAVRRSPAVALAVASPAIASLLVAALASPAGAQPSAAFEQAVDSAVDRGVEFLLYQVSTLDGWTPDLRYPDGYTALQIYALVKSDVSYLHPSVQTGLRLLESFTHEKVYSVSLAVMAYGAILDQMAEDAVVGSPAPFFAEPSGQEPAERPHGEPDRVSKEERPERKPPGRSEILKRMKVAVSWLVRARVRGEGCWNYERIPPSVNPRTARYDHSNSQFAILALGVAEEHGVHSPKEVWQEIARHFIRVQSAEGDPVDARPTFVESTEEKSRTRRLSPGEMLYQQEPEVRARGWGYTIKEGEDFPTISMTSAGQSSVLLAYRSLVRRGGISAVKTKLEKAIRDGYGWLTRFLESPADLRHDPYALYSLEKVGDIGKVERFGLCSWYPVGADMLLATQQPSGNWGRPGTPGAVHDTALALLFLRRASALDAVKRTAIRVTGPAETSKPEFSHRYYVYLPSVDRAVPVIQFFRKLRYRPTPELMQLAREMAGVYDPDHVDELVLFTLSLGRSRSERIKRLGRELIRKTAGLDTDDVEVVRDWAIRWREVVSVGRARRLDAAPRLRRLLAETPSVPLKIRIVWALQRVNDRDAITDLLDLMEADELSLRQAAHGAVVVLSGKSFVFHADGAPGERREELSRWRSWWSAERAAAEKRPGAEERPDR